MYGENRDEAWVKRAADPGERERLCQEKRVLAAVHHPGVARVLPGPDVNDELSLARVAGGDVAGRRFDARETAGLGAAVATTVADLHDLGVVHGGLCAEHILLDKEGRPVLCSFGRSRLAGSSANSRSGDRGGGCEALAAGRRDDVVALACTLLDLFDEGPGDRREARSLRRVLERAASRPPRARELARALATSVKDAGLPGPEAGEVPLAVEAPPVADAALAADAARSEGAALQRPERAAETAGKLAPVRRALGRPSNTPRRKMLVISACGALAAAGLAGEVLTHVGHRPEAGGLQAAPAAACPSADRRCKPLPMLGNRFTTSAGSWTAGEAGDVVVLGRWSCQHVPQVALLRPGVGQVWVFDSWAAPGASVEGRLVADVPGARSLKVLAGPGDCDRLQVVGPSGRTRVLRPSGGR